MNASIATRTLLLIVVWFASVPNSLQAFESCLGVAECTAIMGYDVATGDVTFDFTQRTTTLHLQSTKGLFQGTKPQVLSGLFDRFTANKLFWLNPFGFDSRVDFGPILPSGLTCKQIYEDLVGSTGLYSSGNGRVGLGNLCDGPDPVPNDLDGNELVDATDIDYVMEALCAGEHHLLYDFDKSGQFDRDDLRYYVEQLLLTTAGDANVDRRFDSSDLTLVFQAGEYEDTIAENSRWEEGDWTGDAEFASDDLIAAFQTGAYERPAASVAAVPEPSGMILGCIATWCAIGSRRRRIPSQPPASR